MRTDLHDLEGSGGGSGGSSNTFTQTPDNLRSEDIFEGLLGLGQGRWKGLTNGFKSLRVNDTPLEDGSGKTNFAGWVATFADGDPTQWPQKPALLLGTGASPISINVTLANPAGTGTAVVRTVSNTGADYIDLRFIVNELYHQTKSGIFNQTMHIKVRMKPTGHTTWIDVLVDTTGTTDPTYNASGYSLSGGQTRFFSESYYDDTTGARINTGVTSGQLTITGKTTQAFVREVRIAVPNTGSYAAVSWDVECTLMDIADNSADPIFDKRNVMWESASAVFKDTTLGTSSDWAGLAWLQINGQASDQISGLPTIWGEYYTKIVNTPPSGVYDPTTRQYTGTVWDGSWVKAYTNDPAWVINDLLQDPLAGVSAIAPGSYLNKWDALELSKYCSELVSDGASSTHPRFCLNGVWNDPQRADEFVRNFAGAVGAVVWDIGGGEWRCRVDKIENPVAIFTEENIEGEFTYTHTDVDTRYNDITVKFNNESFEYRPDSVRVFDQTNINAVGRKPVTIPAIGCTNRQEALRRGMLRLRTAMNEYRMVSFTTNRQGRYLEPLSTILVADKSLGYTAPSGSTALANTDARDDTTGRILSLNGARTIITLRDPMRLEPGATYAVKVTVPNTGYNPDATTAPATDWDKPTLVVSSAVTTGSPRGDVTTINLVTALPSNTPPNAVIALEATGLPATPKTYRVMNVEIDDDGERIHIAALEVDTGKYAAADGVTASTYSFELPPATPPAPLNPSGGMLNLRTFASAYTFQRVLEVDWARPSSKFIQGYIVKYQLNDGPQIDIPMTTQLRVEIPNPQFGIYSVTVVTVDTSGKMSQPLSASITITEQSLIGAVGYLTNEAHTVPADNTGTVTSYLGATGSFKVLIGTTDVTAGCTFAITANPQALTGPYTSSSPLETTTGNYSVTGGLDVGEANATLTIRATHTASGYTVDKVFTLAKASAGATGVAKIISLATSHFTFQYNLTVPVTQTTTLTATRTNPGSGTTLWNVSKADGTAILSNQTAAQLVTAGYCSSSSNDVLSITETQFDAKLTANSTTGLIFRALYSDLSTSFDQITIIKLSNGTNGTNGTSAKVIYMSSDRQLITYDGTGTLSPSTQLSTFKIFPQNLSTTSYTISMTDAAGTVINANTYLAAISGSFAASSNNITWTGGGTQFSMTAANFSTARGATNGVIITVTHADGVSDTISIVKAADGANGTNGTNAKLLYMTADRQLITYNSAGAVTPSTQTTLATIFPQNLSTSSYTISMTKADGTVINANTYLTAVSGSFAASSNNITWTGGGTQFNMTAANFDTARGATAGVIITVSHTDGVNDKLSIVKQQDGATGTTGPGGPVIALAADAQAFNFVDGIALDSAQSITVTATLQNTSETINWTRSPAVTLGAPDGTHRTLSIANFGTNEQVTITATGATSGATASITLLRSNINTIGDSLIPDSDFTWSTGGFGSGRLWLSGGGFSRIAL